MLPLPTAVERQVIADGEVLTYQLIRTHSRVRTVGLRLEPDQSIVVRAPLDVSEAFIADFVGRRAAWIRARRGPAVGQDPARLMGDGDTVPFLGESHTLRFSTSAGRTPEVSRAGEVISVALPAQSAPGEADDALVTWFADEAYRELAAATARWALRVGATPRAVVIRNQRTHWGSCAADGVIRYNWRLIFLAPELVDFVVVHELAHLLEANHSPRFWAHVEGQLPDYRERRKALNASRTSLPAFAR